LLVVVVAGLGLRVDLGLVARVEMIGGLACFQKCGLVLGIWLVLILGARFPVVAVLPAIVALRVVLALRFASDGLVLASGLGAAIPVLLVQGVLVPSAFQLLLAHGLASLVSWPILANLLALVFWLTLVI
jgi:hypothetical protein